MKRRIRYMALLLVLCMLALTGCAQPRDTMTLRVCLDAAPATLDPAMASSDAERTVVAHLFENLMKLSRGEDGGIQPVYAAAKSYTVEDNLDGTETYTFTLRQNVRWSDGQTVTAHDFVYAWQRLADPATGSPHAALLDMVAGFDQVQAEQDGSLLQVSAPDDFTFVVKLSYKCAYFLTDVCAGTATMPVRSDAAEREDWSLHSETLLTDGPTWDCAAVSLRAIDQNGNLLPYCGEAVCLSVEGPLKILGPSVVPLRGGMAGTYLATTGEAGRAVLHCRMEGALDTEAVLTVRSREEQNV